jgi:DNA helicase-2/ATP-dependent DNA helicase PcrA
MNHRSFSRIVDLCNSIRFDTDGIQQQPREDHTGGFVRFFIVEKSKSPLWVAKKVSEIMSSTTNDLLWNDLKNVKNLILEHHMVCNNLNFEDFFMPLYVNKELKGDLPKGQIPFVVYFIKVIVKLYIANTNQNEFDFFNVIKKYSNYYKEKLKKLEFNKEILDKINKKMEPVRLIFAKDEFTCWEILIAINEAHLFTLSDDLTDVINWSNLNTFAKEYDENLNKNNSIYLSLQAPFREFISYFEYISGHSSFDTHQGVKGLEFDRVIVSINDDEANGFSFNYNNMFEGFSSNNLQVSKNENTKKLFYVTCSRAKESLAIVYYVEDINKSKAIIEKSKLVVEKEIIQL